MDYFKQKLQENLDPSKEELSTPPKKRKSKPVCCALFEQEVRIIEEIKDRGLDIKIVLTPSKIVQIGLFLLSNIQIDKIPIYNTKSSKFGDRFEIANQELGTKPKSKNKFFTFTLDVKSSELLDLILDRGLDIKRVFSISEVLRLSIHQANALTKESLKEQFLQLQKRRTK